MASKITKEVLEAYLHCKLKGHLKLAGQRGEKCDCENLLIEQRAEVRRAAIEKILARHAEEEITRNAPLTISALKEGAPYLLDATLEDDQFLLCFDGLKKVDGPSKLGDFHYVPMIFHEGEKVRKEQRLFLEVCGLLLSRLQGQMPAFGIVWHGRECKATKVRLNADLRKTERLLRDLKDMHGTENPPKLMLNDHCQMCEFRQSCHAQAVQEDNISLLRGLGEKEIKRYARKGIFTVTQLSHTFRPRRKRRKTARPPTIRYHALQALSIREKKTYVIGTPSISVKPLRLYLDIEGLPDDDFYYLIGLLVCDGKSTTYKSFWADSKHDEAAVWTAFCETISAFGDFTLFHFGRYDSNFLSKMERRYGISEILKNTLRSNSLNVLSLLYNHFYLPIYSNSLKSVAAHFGFNWTTTGASGIQSIAWRHLWEKTKDSKVKNQLVAYNHDDCAALQMTSTAFIAIADAGHSQSSSLGDVIDADNLKRKHPYGFGRNEFCFPELDRLNKCAYFDYQRQRVYAHTPSGKRKRSKGMSQAAIRQNK